MPARRSIRPASCPTARRSTDPDDLRNALLRRPDQFVQTFTEGLMTYAIGRTLEYYDMPTVRRIVREHGGGRLQVFSHRSGGRAERTVQNAPGAAARAGRRWREQ